MKERLEELKLRGRKDEVWRSKETGDDKDMGRFIDTDFSNQEEGDDDRNNRDEWKDWSQNGRASDSELAIDIVSSSNDENSLSTNETQKTGDSKQKFVFSRADSKSVDSDLESISEECSEGRLIEDNMFIKQIRADLSSLIQKHESLSTELKSFSSKSSIKINSLRFCIILLKHQQQKALDQFISFSEEKAKLLERKEELDRGYDKIKELMVTLEHRKYEALERFISLPSSKCRNTFRKCSSDSFQTAILI